MLLDEVQNYVLLILHLDVIVFYLLVFLVAPEIFQRNIKQIIEDLDGTDVYIDDIIVFGDTLEEHNRRLEEVLKRLSAYNFKLNKSKSKFCVSEIKYLGHIITKEGLKVDHEKVQAIVSMDKPTDKKAVERFLGMITYLGRFIENLSEKTHVLRELLKKEVNFVWEHSHETAFEQLKAEICKCPVLKLYNVSKKTILSVDASKNGVDAVLLQDRSPVAYASKSLTETQQRWAKSKKSYMPFVLVVKGSVSLLEVKWWTCKRIINR